MHTAWSAKRTASESRSASENTATEGIPSSLQAQMTRKAISPRFAMRILLNMEENKSNARQKAKGKRQNAKVKKRAFFLPFAFCLLPFAFCLGHRPVSFSWYRSVMPQLRLPDRKERLSILHGLSVIDQTLDHFAGDVRFDFVHQLHRFHDAQHLAALHALADADE